MVRNAMALIGMVWLTAPAAQAVTMEHLARCFYDSLYPAPELFPPASVEPAWQPSPDRITVIWYGSGFRQWNAPLRLAATEFRRNGEIRIETATPASLLDRLSVITNAPGAGARARIADCQRRVTSGSEPVK